MGMDVDHPSAAGFRAGRPQRAGAAKCTEAGDAVAAAVADGHGVAGRAGDGAGGQVNRELVFGIAVGVAHRGNLGAHVAAPCGLLIQGGSVGVAESPYTSTSFGSQPAAESLPLSAPVLAAGSPAPDSVWAGGAPPPASVSAAHVSVAGSVRSSSMTSRSAVLAAVTATLVISSSPGSTLK